MKYINSLIFLTLLTSFSLYGQDMVSGVVYDSDGSTLPGVSLIIKGTTIGTVTDLEGRYSLTLDDVDENAIIVFSFIGFKTQEIEVGGRSQIDVTMIVDEKQLDEIVVIGYGEVKRSNVTSSIATVKGEELTKLAVGNPAEALQGKAAGVQVLSSGGSPGAAPQILIRGITTNNGSSPLIVLDGVPLPGGTSLNFINPADIESFQILKDASASAIYGSRASNGVILITTKRGQEGKAVVNVDASYGIQNLKKVEMAGSDEYIAVQNMRSTNDGQPAIYDESDIGPNTDWWDQTIENYAPLKQLNVSVAGGNEKNKFAGSLSYFKQESNYQKGWYEKITGRFNYDFKINERVSFRQDLNPRFETWENTPSLLYSIFRKDPLSEVYLPQDERKDRNIFSIYSPGVNLAPNPVGQVARQFNKTKYFGFFSNTQLRWEILDRLVFKTQLGLSTSKTRQDQFEPKYIATTNNLRPINNVSRTINERLDYVLNNTLSYDKEFGKHYMSATAGILWDSNNSNSLKGTRTDVPSDTNVNLRYLNAATGENVTATGNEVIETIFSGILRGIYNYDNRYFFTGTIRMDESSKFSKENRQGIFPSVSLAWDIDSEEFFNVKEISNLRLKLGYGQIGNQNISRNGQFFSVGSGNYVLGGDRVVTNYLSQFGNPDLRWERVEDYNVGLTASLFNKSIDFSVEYYQKTSNDLLFNVNLPNYTGIPGLVAKNIGSFKSKGWDFSLGYNKKIEDFDLGLNLTVSTNKSEASQLATGNEQLFGQKREDLGNRFIKITEEGQTVGLFYGFKTDGIFQNQTEINSHSTEDGTLLQPNAKPGDLRFLDINQDGLVDDEDLTTIGDPFPDFYGGLTANLGYKNWDMSMQWYGTYGNEVFNYTRTFFYSGTVSTNVVKGALDKVWTPENTDAEFPRLTGVDRNGNYLRPSNLFIEDASYLRLRNLQVGYTFKWGETQRCRVYFSTQNLLTLTKYSGLDPEVQANGNIINAMGVDYARNPVARTYLLGLNLTL